MISVRVSRVPFSGAGIRNNPKPSVADVDILLFIAYETASLCVWSLVFEHLQAMSCTSEID